MFEVQAQDVPLVQPDATPDTLAEAVQFDPGLVLDKLRTWLEAFQRLLPNPVVALAVLLIFVGLGWRVQNAIRRWAERHNREKLGDVLGSFLKWLVTLAGVLVSLVVVLPTFRPGDL